MAKFCFVFNLNGSHTLPPASSNYCCFLSMLLPFIGSICYTVYYFMLKSFIVSFMKIHVLRSDVTTSIQYKALFHSTSILISETSRHSCLFCIHLLILYIPILSTLFALSLRLVNIAHANHILHRSLALTTHAVSYFLHVLYTAYFAYEKKSVDKMGYILKLFFPFFTLATLTTVIHDHKNYQKNIDDYFELAW